MSTFCPVALGAEVVALQRVEAMGSKLMQVPPVLATSNNCRPPTITAASSCPPPKPNQGSLATPESGHSPLLRRTLWSQSESSLCSQGLTASDLSPLPPALPKHVRNIFTSGPGHCSLPQDLHMVPSVPGEGLGDSLRRSLSRVTPASRQRRQGVPQRIPRPPHYLSGLCPHNGILEAPVAQPGEARPRASCLPGNARLCQLHVEPEPLTAPKQL